MEHCIGFLGAEYTPTLFGLDHCGYVSVSWQIRVHTHTPTPHSQADLQCSTHQHDLCKKCSGHNGAPKSAFQT